MEDAGIDLAPEDWTLKLWLRGQKRFLFSISGIEQKRLWSLFQEAENSSFLVFNTRTERVALNRNQIQAWQFLWDAPNLVDLTENEPGYMNVVLAHQSEAIRFDTKPDTEQFDPDAEKRDDRSSELQEIFVALEVAGGESDTLITFEDVDGEEVFIRASEIALLSVPISDVEPAVGTTQDEDLDEIGDKDKCIRGPRSETPV